MFDGYHECCTIITSNYLKLKRKKIGTVGIQKRVSSMKDDENIWIMVIMFLLALFYLDHYSLFSGTLCYYKNKIKYREIPFIKYDEKLH